MLTVITGMRRPARPPVRRLRSPRSVAAIDNLFVPQLAPRTAARRAFSWAPWMTQRGSVCQPGATGRHLAGTRLSSTQPRWIWSIQPTPARDE